MTLTAHSESFVPPTAMPRRVPLERLKLALLWLTGVAGAFVFIEPSPYEIVSLTTILVFAFTGLALRAGLMPLVVILILNNIGFSLAVIPVIDAPKTFNWVLISWYLAATAIFFAAMLATNTNERLTFLVRGYTIAALIASLAGIAGYFNLLPGDILTLYGRARGTFNDPNVLGAFLIFPMLISLQRLLSGRLSEIVRGSVIFVILALGLLLSFSRGAWGQFAVASALMVALMFITSRSPRERMRIIIAAIVGTTLLFLLILGLLSTEKVGQLFQERFALEQSYDVGPLGRFGRHILGFLMALDHPLGIGPLQFSHYFPEDPHNTYLNAFMSGGWLAGFCYLTLVGVTLLIGLRFAVVVTPWHSAYLAVFSSFAATAGESAIIDTDHWRHYWLLIGTLWGLIAASQAHVLRGRSSRKDQALARASQHV